MRHRRGHKLEEYAEYLYERCPGLSTVNKIHADLRYIKGIISGKRINHDLPCTEGAGKLCQIWGDLTLWNEFLWLVDAQLLEVTPGVLGVVCLHGEVSAPVYDNILRRHACMLLHWLVKEHRCVKVLELEGTVIPRGHHLFCDALRVSSGLRRLKLRRYYFEDTVSKAIVGAIGSLAMLEELDISKLNLSMDAVIDLASLLTDMKSLRSFSFCDISLVESTAQIFFESLGSAKHITALVLAKICVRHDREDAPLPERVYNPEPIFKMLEQNTVLKKLHLRSFSWLPSDAQPMVKAMSKNATLESLVIDDLFWSMDIDFFAELMESNTGLKELALPYVIIGCFTPFVRAIQKNSSLQKLTLGVSKIDAAEAELFFQAVACSHSLEHVNLGSIGRENVKDFCRIRKDTGTETRVEFKTRFENPTLCCETFNICKSLGNICFSFHYNHIDPAVLCGLFDQLQVCHWLAKLSISFYKVIDDASAASLARYVSSAKALKDLELDFETSESTLPVLLEGISSNKSISKLSLNPWAFDVPESQMFGAMLKASMTLNELTLRASHCSESDDEFWDDPSFAILLYIPSCLSQNYTVIDVDISDHREAEEDMFRVKDTMRRNLSFLQRAAQFAMGVRSKQCAEAFERVHRSEALVTKLQELACVTKAEAREKIKSSLRDLDENFLVMAGVVRKKVVCVEPTSGQITLDRIGVDNWLQIRSYLKVGDVLDEPVAECQKAPAKRRHVRKRKLEAVSS